LLFSLSLFKGVDMKRTQRVPAGLVILAAIFFAACPLPTEDENNSNNDQTVDILDLTGKVTAPVKNIAPDTREIATDQYTGSVAWTVEGTAFSGSTFEADTEYQALVTLTPKTGFTFTGLEEDSFEYRTVTGTTITNAANSGVVTIAFPATMAEGAPDVVFLRDLTNLVTAPVTGEAPATTGIDTDQYTVSVAWETGGSAFNGPVFVGGTVYQAVVTLTAEPGFIFTGVGENSFSYTGATVTNAADSGTVTITFNETVSIEGTWNNISGTGSNGWYHTYTFTGNSFTYTNYLNRTNDMGGTFTVNETQISFTPTEGTAWTQGYTITNGTVIGLAQGTGHTYGNFTKQTGPDKVKMLKITGLTGTKITRIGVFPSGTSLANAQAGTGIIAASSDINISNPVYILFWNQADTTQRWSAETGLYDVFLQYDNIYAKASITFSDAVTEAAFYTVTFDADYGTVPSTSVQVISGNAVGTLPTPTRPGYAFEGWYTAEDGGGTEFMGVSIVSDITVYAKWTFNGTVEEKYRRTYMFFDMDEEGGPTDDTYILGENTINGTVFDVPISNVRTDGGGIATRGEIDEGNDTLSEGTWAYLYEGDTKIGIVTCIIRATEDDYGAKMILLGQSTFATYWLSTFETIHGGMSLAIVSGGTVDWSDMGDIYQGFGIQDDNVE
jgi:uncharacterized repeat protein (TIGR02543 family)